MKKTIRLLIVDDHVMIRLGLAALMADEPDIKIVGEACNGTEAIALFDQLLPDVTVMDGILPDIHGVDAIRQIRTSSEKRPGRLEDYRPRQTGSPLSNQRTENGKVN